MLIKNHRNGSHHIYLLDTMNNVLGIFVLVLIMTLVVGATPDTTDSRLEQQYAALLKTLGLADNQVNRQTIEQFQTANVACRAAIQKMQTKLLAWQAEDEKLKKAAADAVKRAKGLDADLPHPPPQADLEEAKARLDRECAKLDADLTTSRNQLKALLEQGPGVDQLATLDQSQSANVMFKPKSVATFILRGGKIGYLNADTIGESINTKGVNTYVEQAKSRGNHPSRSGLVAFCNSADLGDDTFRVIMEEPAGPGLVLILQPRVGSTWVDSKDLNAEISWFRDKLKTMDASTTLVDLRPWPSSFDNYLKVNAVAKSMGFHTSWTPYDEAEELRQVIGREDFDGPRVVPAQAPNH